MYGGDFSIKNYMGKTPLAYGNKFYNKNLKLKKLVFQLALK